MAAAAPSAIAVASAFQCTPIALTAADVNAFDVQPATGRGADLLAEASMRAVRALAFTAAGHPGASHERANGNAAGSAESESSAVIPMDTSKDAVSDGSLHELRELFYDAMVLFVAGQVPSHATLVHFVRSTPDEVTQSPELQYLLAELVALLELEISGLPAQDPARDRLFQLVLLLIREKLVTEDAFKERLEAATLAAVSITRDAATFKTTVTRMRTKLFYKQQKFNLFREESEGYAKLISELSQESLSVAVCHTVSRHVQSLIGFFDLDPNRVMDIILNCFENEPSRHAFFVALIRSLSFRNESLCSILGFRFHHKQKHPEQNAANLCLVAACLLRGNLISLADLYPHLSPDDAELQPLFKNKLAQALVTAKQFTMVNLGGGPPTAAAAAPTGASAAPAVPALAATPSAAPSASRAGSLLPTPGILGTAPGTVAPSSAPASTSATATASTAAAATTTAAPAAPPAEERLPLKLLLIQAVLTVRDWPTAEALLARFPEFTALTHAPIAKAMCGLLLQCIEPFYLRHCIPAGARPDRIRRSTNVDFQVASEFLCQSLEQVFAIAFPLALKLGPYVSHDIVLTTKLARIVKYLAQTDRAKYTADIEQLLELVLLPAASLVSCNAPLNDEIWETVKGFSYPQRFQLYGTWKNHIYSRFPELIVQKASVAHQTRYSLRRLSTTNFKQSGRQISKLCHANPSVVFVELINKVQVYDNFVMPIVEALKYLTSMDYDMLIYCILEALVDPRKERVKADGRNVSGWLSGLAMFAAHVVKRYTVDIVPLLQFVTKQLRAGQTVDLLIVKELVTKMAGIEVTVQPSESQIQALAGGDLLRSEGGSFSQSRNLKRTPARLLQALISSNLAMPLLLLIAQQKHAVVFSDQHTSHTKLLGDLFDQCHGVLLQYSEFLVMTLTKDGYAKLLPSMRDLMDVYYLDLETTMHLWRPSFHHSVRVANSRGVSFGDAFDLAMEPLKQQLVASTSIRPLKDISLNLVSIFWSLSLSDIFVPGDRYDQELQTQKALLAALEANRDETMSQSKRRIERERLQTVIRGLQEERKHQEANKAAVLEKLQQEKDNWFPQVGSNKLVQSTQELMQTCIFPRLMHSVPDAVYCVKFMHLLHSLSTPRCSSLLMFDQIMKDTFCTITMCSESEAQCYGYFLLETLKLYTRWANSSKLFEAECRVPGFLYTRKAPKDGKAPPAAAESKPADAPPAASTSQESSDGAVPAPAPPAPTLIEYDMFRSLAKIWTTRLADAFTHCLGSSDFVHIRNSLMILHRLSEVFPMHRPLVLAIESQVAKLMADERQDVKTLATTYMVQLVRIKSVHFPEERNKSIASVNLGGDVKPMAIDEPAAPASAPSTTSAAADSSASATAGTSSSSKERLESSSGGRESSREGNRESREHATGHRDSSRDPRDASRDHREPSREPRARDDSHSRDRDHSSSREPRARDHDGSVSRDSRENRDSRDTRDGRDGREARDSSRVRRDESREPTTSRAARSPSPTRSKSSSGGSATSSALSGGLVSAGARVAASSRSEPSSAVGSPVAQPHVTSSAPATSSPMVIDKPQPSARRMVDLKTSTDSKTAAADRAKKFGTPATATTTTTTPTAVAADAADASKTSSRSKRSSEDSNERGDVKRTRQDEQEAAGSSASRSRSSKDGERDQPSSSSSSSSSRSKDAGKESGRDKSSSKDGNDSKDSGKESRNGKDKDDDRSRDKERKERSNSESASSSSKDGRSRSKKHDSAEDGGREERRSKSSSER
ncbi:Thoc2 protein [Capsaspora owczarzaki ATCC 30864]|uniref:THO complex subunit 2 n=1 Tax=Capsaspora owczarzaki (strain ATCC 30864) TaxID=595528 RepID=A0A0D2X531_CAPO3|nr:Thoc2 protein [Capsaspora owczarzaki ATCC 30864]KJE97099.1 Thoc2 protein [Capsaspora owczarzaki ATCC 30864]|eukprot:XP_004343443.2 Thoc2 protein [Capsaspora owczarzaki ATCC 30864]